MRAFAAPTALPTRAVVTSHLVSAEGALALGAPAIALSFETSGKVAAVHVSPGQVVKTGDLLAEIEDTALQDAVADAQLSLDLLAATIDQQSAPASEAEIAAAQAALNSAYASYNAVKAGASQAELERSKNNVDSAWLRYLSSKAARDIACGSDAESTRCKTAEASLGNAYESWLAAKAGYEALLEPVSSNTLTQAYASVASAKARLESLQSGVSEAQQKIDAAQYAQAQTALKRAQDNLAKAKLVSPCECVVQQAHVAPGSRAAGVAFTLVDLAGLQFQAGQVTERDVSKIQIGAPATVRLRAYDDAFTGRVSAVLPQASGVRSDTALFTVIIALDPTDKMLLPGMTGQADIRIE